MEIQQMMLRWQCLLNCLERRLVYEFMRILFGVAYDGLRLVRLCEPRI